MLSRCRDCICKDVTKDRLGEHGGIWDLLVNTLDGICVAACRNKYDRYTADFPQPPRDFDAFAASFQTDIDESHIRLIIHSK